MALEVNLDGPELDPRLEAHDGAWQTGKSQPRVVVSLDMLIVKSPRYQCNRGRAAKEQDKLRLSADRCGSRCGRTCRKERSPAAQERRGGLWIAVGMYGTDIGNAHGRRSGRRA